MTKLRVKSECYDCDPCRLVHFSIYPSIFHLFLHSFIFSSGGVHSHWDQGGFLSGNLLKAALGKIFMKKYTGLIELNHKVQPIHTNEKLKVWPIFPNEMLVSE